MPLDLGRIQALCFDVDGTLSDTDDRYVSLLSDLLGRLPFLTRPEEKARRFVMWFESPATFLMGLADRLYIDDEIIGAVDWLARHSARRLRPGNAVPGTLDMLEGLVGRYPMAVVSARDERSTLGFLDQVGMSKYFRVVVTALSASRTKPYPDPVLLAARELGIAPEACVMIGDTTVDIRAGRAAGAQTVGVLCGFGESHELLRHGADMILRSTAQLGEVLTGP